MDVSLLNIIIPALCAGCLVLLSHVPLGIEVLRRGIIFIDIAIAQIAGFGIILASYWGFEAHGFELQAIALASALSGAALLNLLESRSGHYQEAIIGIAFVLASTGSLLLLSKNPHGGEHLQSLLTGQILWVEWSQLWFPGALGVVFFALWLVKPTFFKGGAFYYLFALSITVSVQLVGVYLVFASLILPAIAVARITHGAKVFIALLVGLSGYILGLLVSVFLDLPSGAVVVWMLGLIAILSRGVLQTGIAKSLAKTG